MGAITKSLRRRSRRQSRNTLKETGDTRRQQGVIWAYTAAIAGAELFGTFVDPLVGLICHALLLPILLGHSVRARSSGIRQSLPVLALIPILRIASLTTATPHLLQPVFWYILAGLPLLFAAILAARLLGFTGSRLGLQMASWPPQLLISLSAIPLSFVAYQLHDAILPQPNDGAASALTGVLLVLIVLGMLEEVIFRGLLLQATKTVFGSWAIPYSALLYAIVHVGWQSVEVMAFAAVAGLFWGWCAMRTGSIWGVMFAHGLLNAYVLIWPLVWP